MGTVKKHYRAEISRCRGGIDVAGKPVFHQGGDVAWMVDMRMGKYQDIDTAAFIATEIDNLKTKKDIQKINDKLNRIIVNLETKKD